MIKKIAGYILGGIVVVMVLGYLTAMMLTELVPAILTRDWEDSGIRAFCLSRLSGYMERWSR